MPGSRNLAHAHVAQVLSNVVHLSTNQRMAVFDPYMSSTGAVMRRSSDGSVVPDPCDSVACRISSTSTWTYRAAASKKLDPDRAAISSSLRIGEHSCGVSAPAFRGSLAHRFERCLQPRERLPVDDVEHNRLVRGDGGDGGGVRGRAKREHPSTRRTDQPDRFTHAVGERGHVLYEALARDVTVLAAQPAIARAHDVAREPVRQQPRHGTPVEFAIVQRAVDEHEWWPFAGDVTGDLRAVMRDGAVDQDGIHRCLLVIECSFEAARPDPPGDPVLGMALYQQGELLRLRGDFSGAESCYREASGRGHTMQPGLALLRLAQRRHRDAVAAIDRTVTEAPGPVERSRVLSAYVEIKLDAGDVDDARTAVDELDAIAAAFDSSYLRALVEYARGCVHLADGDAQAACVALRRAWLAWHELEAPYETARVRLQMARACAGIGDDDTAEMELDAAREVFEQLGAAPALEQLREVTGHTASPPLRGLTPREVEVLRLLATGATNREIADTLVISDKTVARHVSNMFTKLGVSTQAAATAYAYQNDLV